MRVDVVSTLVIERPCPVVASFASDPDNAPRWYMNIKAVRWVTPPPLHVGSRIAFEAHFLGRKLVYMYEVIELEENRRFVMRTAEGPFPMETSYTWEAIGPNATRMNLRNRGEPRGFSALVAPFMGWAMHRANTKDLQALRKVLEATT
jgi:Polyketide cyclase / dehydrase and lipid transport